MAKWLAKEFDWDTGRYTGNYYDIAEAGIVAVFVDSFYGLDTNAGTAAAPFKTLGQAITTLNSTGANGSRIFMNGIFSETLPTQTYWYEFIGCGGGRNGRTVFIKDSVLTTRVIISKEGTRLHNIHTLNYNDNTFVNYVGYYAVNSIIWNCTWGSSGNLYAYFYYSNFKNYHSYTIFGGHTYYFVGSFNVFEDVTSVRTLDTGQVGNSYSYIGLLASLNGNIVGTAPQFIKPTDGDYNVRITSPLIGAGTVDEITGIAANVGGVQVGLPYNGITPEFTTEGGATITDLTIDANGKFTITSPATTGTLETALMDLGNIYPLENIDLFNVFDFAAGEITQGVFEDFVSPRMTLTIKLKYGLTEAEVDECPWLLIEYGKQPTFSGTGASRVGNADATFDPDTFQEITCRYMKLFITLQNNS